MVYAFYVVKILQTTAMKRPVRTQEEVLLPIPMISIMGYHEVSRWDVGARSVEKYEWLFVNGELTAPLHPPTSHTDLMVLLTFPSSYCAPVLASPLDLEFLRHAFWRCINHRAPDNNGCQVHSSHAFFASNNQRMQGAARS